MGRVRPCNHSTTILGNLLTESFGDILAPGRIAPFVNALPDHCLPCDQRAICQGGCKASAQVCYGTLTEPDPFLRQAIPVER